MIIYKPPFAVLLYYILLGLSERKGTKKVTPINGVALVKMKQE